MNPYTNIYGQFFTGAQRTKSIPIQNQAIKDGILPPLKDQPCRFCGQMHGLKAWHCEDYDKPVESAVCLCWRCHMMFHSRFRRPEDVFRYLYEVVVLGVKYPPVPRHDFKLLDQHFKGGR